LDTASASLTSKTRCPVALLAVAGIPVDDEGKLGILDLVSQSLLLLGCRDGRTHYMMTKMWSGYQPHASLFIGGVAHANLKEHHR
jgi:hypothetical protein